MAAEGKRSINRTLRRVETIDDLDLDTYAVQTGTIFKTRCGPDYSVNGMKDYSEESMMTLYGVDVFRSHRKCPDIMRNFSFPTDLPEVKRDENDGFYAPKLLVINIMCPLYDAGTGFFSAPVFDGENLSVVFYFALNQTAYDAMKNDETNAASLLKRFFQMNTKSPEHYELRGRLKGIPVLINADDVNLGFALRPLVTRYNGKPFLTGPKYHSFTKTEDYLECDVDVHMYQILARRTVWGLYSEFHSMIADFGFVIEGKDDEELPETMLGAVRISQITATEAQYLDD